MRIFQTQCAAIAEQPHRARNLQITLSGQLKVKSAAVGMGLVFKVQHVYALA